MRIVDVVRVLVASTRGGVSGGVFFRLGCTPQHGDVCAANLASDAAFAS